MPPRWVRTAQDAPLREVRESIFGTKLKVNCGRGHQLGGRRDPVQAMAAADERGRNENTQTPSVAMAAADERGQREVDVDGESTSNKAGRLLVPMEDGGRLHEAAAELGAAGVHYLVSTLGSISTALGAEVRSVQSWAALEEKEQDETAPQRSASCESDSCGEKAGPPQHGRAGRRQSFQSSSGSFPRGVSRY